MHKRLFFGLPVEFSPLPVEPGTEAPWTVLAYEAELKGYRLSNGQVAKITRADLEAAIKNFARYPKVPLVVEHADTRDGPTEWAQPRGWITELRLGTMQRGGKAVTTLEGRLAVSPEVRLSIVGDVATGVPPTWPFCSVTLGQGTDDESGVALGAVLYSVSLTAHPRLTDVPRLAAGRYYEEVSTRGDVLSMLRCVFDLPVTSDESDVLAALDKLSALAGQAEQASGVDTDELFDCLRRSLRLPALTTSAEIIAEVRKALAALPADATMMSRGHAAHAPEKPMKFIALLATFGLPAVADEETAERSVLALAQDGADARRSLNVPPGAPVATRLAEVVTAAAELAKVQPELATLRADADTRAEKDRSSAVDAVCLTKGWGDDAKPALLALAKSDPATFAAKYPPPSAVELAQRAQDGARTTRVVAASQVEAGKSPAGASTLNDQIGALRAVYSRAGQLISVGQAVDLIQRGETAETAKSAFGF